MILWFLITGIGNVLVTGFTALTIAIWLAVSREWKMSLLWCALAGAAMLVVLATKVAFIGWGIGIEAVDMTCISGHATLAALVLPILSYFGLQSAPRKINSPAVFLGIGLAALIAVSRVMVNAHSGSEALAGWMFGTSVSLLFLSAMNSQAALRSRRWLLLCCFTLVFVSPAVKPIRSEDMITKFALYLSGHDVPFTRKNWGHNSQEKQFWYSGKPSTL